MDTNESDIRSAVHKHLLLNSHSCPSTQVINELGVAHGDQRIDIAVISNTLHGYEIKSSKDNLKRLPSQINIYSEYFEKLSIVVAPKHLSKVKKISPFWSEIILAEKLKSGLIQFRTVQKGRINPDINLFSVLHLLWKKEALDFLEYLNVDGNYKNSTRIELYKIISETTSYAETLKWIKHCFKKRKNWRADLQL